MTLQMLVERISNPLRKKSLEGAPSNLEDYKNYVAGFEDYLVYDDHSDDPELQDIKDKYLGMARRFPARAKAWLNKVAEQRGKDLLLRSKIEPSYKKVYEKQGVQVFVNEEFLDSSQYVEGTYNHRIIKRCVDLMLRDTKDLMPNRYPKIIISDRAEDKHLGEDFAGMSFDKLVYLDQFHMDNYKIWIHEFAHYMAETIPSQSRVMLQQAYKELLDIYWKSVKKRRVDLESISEHEAEKLRAKMAKKLNFPEYGLTDPDEFFAVLIENWKNLPNNRATYRYKSLVKQILSRM